MWFQVSRCGKRIPRLRWYQLWFMITMGTVNDATDSDVSSTFGSIGAGGLAGDPKLNIGMGICIELDFRIKQYII